MPGVRLIGLVLAALPSLAQTTQSVSDLQTENAKKMAAAADLQRAAAQRQTAPAAPDAFFFAGWSGPAMLPPPLPDCSSLTDSETEPLIRAAAARTGLNPALIKAVIRQESGFRLCAVSEKGAMGLMQLMPETAQALGAGNLFDPEQNIGAGAMYLKQMLSRFKGDISLALAAYNAGPEKVDGPKPAVPDIAETREYVASIISALGAEPAEMPAKVPRNQNTKDR